MRVSFSRFLVPLVLLDHTPARCFGDLWTRAVGVNVLKSADIVGFSSDFDKLDP